MTPYQSFLYTRFLRRLGVDNVNKGGLQAGTANEETVNVLLLGELVAVLLADTATVDDSGVVRSGLADLLGEVFADGGVHLLGLLGAGDLAGANGPDGLVGNDDLAPVLDLLGDGAELVGDDLDGLVGLSLLEGLANAENNAEAVVEGGLGLGSDEVVGLLEDDTTLRVTGQGPGDVGLLELAGRDLTGEGTVGLVEDVLGSDLETGAEVLTGEEKVEGRRGDDDLCKLLAFGHTLVQCLHTDVGVDLGLVQVVDDALDRVNGTVHLEVTSDEELTTHVCGCVCGEVVF
jgi:hypothetical protein